MKRITTLIMGWIAFAFFATANNPQIVTTPGKGYFPLVSSKQTAGIYIDNQEEKVVEIAADMFAADMKRVTGKQAEIFKTGNRKELPAHPIVVAGTIGRSRLIDWLANKKLIELDDIQGKWESFVITTVEHPQHHTPMLVIAGSDRRGTAYGLTTLSEAIGVSPWYWWADVTPQKKDELYVEPGRYRQGEPSVQYRGIFINDERFGGWAIWAEKTFDKETGKVGPKTYQKVFELLLRLKGNYLWPAMHNGSKAFNSNPENARLADDYAIVMGSSHCEQMLRNNEDEWKNVGTYGDFNYMTNRQTMINYWEERVKTNGQYENIYTLGLRGIHDYPMEGANSTLERVALMQQAIDDQREILRRNIDKPIEEIPQILCTYEEVLDAYHNGLKIPDEVTLLWSDDKHGYTRNLSNPEEMKRKGGAGIYYHLSYHGDPASWIWLSPLSPSFIATELHKAYTFGARKIWVFNVGDIKPAEKEISFAMDLAWDIEKWKPERAHNYIYEWASKTFGKHLAQEIAEMQAKYYRLQAAGKDSHVYFIDYTDQQIAQRMEEFGALAQQAQQLSERIPADLKDAYFELILYPIRGAALLNEYQLSARRSMARATAGDSIGAINDGKKVESTFNQLNEWTNHYNKNIQHGKWGEFFNWQPYHWYRSEKIDPPYCTPQLFEQIQKGLEPRFLSVEKALSAEGMTIESEREGEIALWIEALSPIRNFSKAPEDNVFCQVSVNGHSFKASATPINNVWHAPFVGPMWSKVASIQLKKGTNQISISQLEPGTRIDRMFIGLYPPFRAEPRERIAAYDYQSKFDNQEGSIHRISGLGYSDGVLVLPFDTPSYNGENKERIPYVEYNVNLQEGDHEIEIRTLSTLHVYEGRDARYAVQLGDHAPEVFSIHAGDFSAEWRWNVLRGYASRRISIPSSVVGKQKLKIYFLDPGIVLLEIDIHSTVQTY